MSQPDVKLCPTKRYKAHPQDFTRPNTHCLVCRKCLRWKEMRSGTSGRVVVRITPVGFGGNEPSRGTIVFVPRLGLSGQGQKSPRGVGRPVENQSAVASSVDSAARPGIRSGSERGRISSS